MWRRRDPGQQYLKVVITKILSEFLEKDESLEINPLKVYEWMINDYETRTGKLTTLNRKPTAEEAAANADVQGIIAPRIQTLGEISDHVITTLIASVKSVPYGIRWICKQIFNLAQVCSTYTHAIAHSLISASSSNIPPSCHILTFPPTLVAFPLEILSHRHTRATLYHGRWFLFVALCESRHRYASCLHARRRPAI